MTNKILVTLYYIALGVILGGILFSEQWGLWLQNPTAAIAALSNIVLAIVAVWALFVARRQLRENERIREIQDEPNVIAYVTPHHKRHAALMFVISNQGNGPAFDISASFRDPISDPPGSSKDLFNNIENLCRSPIPVLVKGDSLSGMFGMGPELFEDQRFLSPILVDVRYKNERGTLYEREFVVDIASLQFTIRIGEKDIEDVAEELVKINRNIDSIINHGSIKVVAETMGEHGNRIRQRETEIKARRQEKREDGKK